MALVDVTYSIAGSVVTSVDTGVPVGAIVADGTQIDPNSNSPYPVGTVLYYDEYGILVPVYTNESNEPIVNINTTQTWAVTKEPLVRESLLFNRPTKFGRFKQPIDWVPYDSIHEVWGTIQMIIGGKDVTYFRGHPSEMGAWTSNEPNGDAATSVSFPQISWWERPNVGELYWTAAGKDVTIYLVRPNGTKKVLFEGLTVTHSYSGKGAGLTLEIIGTLYQADHTPYIQELYPQHRDVGKAIADIMDGAVSRHYAACNRPHTGIATNIRGSGGARLTQGVQDLLSTAFTSDTVNQWTITNLPGRRPYVHLKDKTTHHWTMAMGHPGLDLQLTNDFQQMIGMVWGSGIGPNGESWFNARYPGIRIEIPPPYPLAVGQVFTPGGSHTGFDEFADEMRTRGYKMYSGDTYDARDEDEVRDVQKRSGITIDGIVGGQTWSTVFGVGGNFASLAGAHISPLAAITQNVQYLERADGSRIGPNPHYDRSVLAIGRLEEYGQASKAEGIGYARREIKPRQNNDPLWVGSATVTMDPENGSRWEMRAGQNIFVKFFYRPGTQPGGGDGLLLHISQASVNPGGSVSLQLSYLAHDMTTLAAIRDRNKNTLDPARRKTQSTRASKISQDRVIPWDSEAGGGKIPMHNLQGGFWLCYPIPGGQIGTINETIFVCATSLTVHTIDDAFTHDGVLSGAKKFCVAIFSKPVTANFMRDTVGNPLTTANVWSDKAAKLEKAGMLQAYGASEQGAGYWPGQEAKDGPLTGKMLDGTSWPWKSSRPPFLFVAEYCESSTRMAGYLRNAPLGTS